MGRPAGRCQADGADLNTALVATGWAQADTAALAGAETEARTHKRGIWQTN
jgi:endonuclease YncB( thermonuclease family)